MTLTLNLPKDEEQRLAQKAHAAGIDLQTYVECIVRAAASRPPIDEILRPVRDAFHASGMTEDELGEVLEKAKHDMRLNAMPGITLHEPNANPVVFDCVIFAQAIINDAGPAAACLELARSRGIRLF